MKKSSIFNFFIILKLLTFLSCVEDSVPQDPGASVPTVTLTSVQNVLSTNVANYTLSGSCSEVGSEVVVSVGGISPAVQPLCVASTWSVSFDLSTVADNAVVAISADHSDAQGNKAAQAVAFVVKDTIAPVLAITSSATINFLNVSNYTISGTCSENGLEVTVNVSGETPAVQPTCGNNGPGSWLAQLDLSSSADGVLLLTADYSDQAGNEALQESISIIKDTVSPAVTITSAPSITNSNQSTYIISGSCSEDGLEVTVNVSGETPGVQPTCGNNGSGSWLANFDVSAAPDSLTLAVTADHKDSVGNGAIQATFSIAKDTVLATVTISSAPNITNLNKAAYTLSGTCSELGREVSVSVAGLAPGTQPTCTANTWSVTFDVSVIVDSTLLLVSADHVDFVGNGAIQATFSIAKDTVLATVTISSAPNITNLNKAAYTLSGTCSELGREVSVSVAGLAPGTQPTCTANTWSVTFDVSIIVDSTLLLVSADHVDFVGNGAIQATFSIAKDTTN